MVYTEFKLFVGGLSWDTDTEGLRAAFSPFGEVAFHRVCSDQETGNSRGFGFVSFTSEAEGMKAIEAMNGASLDGRELSVRAAGEKPNPNGAAKAYGQGGGGSFKNQECFAWTKFECSRGDTCRFSHDGPGGAGEKPKKPCFAWAKGECKFGDTCHYSHDAVPGTVDANASQRQTKKALGEVKIDLGDEEKAEPKKQKAEVLEDSAPDTEASKEVGDDDGAASDEKSKDDGEKKKSKKDKKEKKSKDKKRKAEAVEDGDSKEKKSKSKDDGEKKKSKKE